MSTRACYRFFPDNGPNDWPGVVTVYKHGDGYQRFAGDIAYLYDIRCENGKIRITAYTATERDDVWTVEKLFEGSIAQLKRRKP